MNKQLIKDTIRHSHKLYVYLEDLKDMLFEITNDETIDLDRRKGLYECLKALNDVELYDEIIARLGCIDLGDGK